MHLYEKEGRFDGFKVEYGKLKEKIKFNEDGMNVLAYCIF